MSISKKELVKNQKMLGSRIRQIRESKGMSQLDLASLCNLDKTAISRIENGRSNLTLKTMLLLSKMLEVEIKDFFNF